MSKFYFCECGVVTIRGMECFNCGAVEPIGSEQMKRVMKQVSAKDKKTDKPKGKPGRPKAVFVQGKPWKERVKEYKNGQEH